MDNLINWPFPQIGPGVHYWHGGIPNYEERMAAISRSVKWWLAHMK